MSTDKNQNVQDVFLNHVRKNKTPVTVFLVNGVKLQGIITWFDNFCVLLRRDGRAVGLTESLRPDVVLMDIAMARMDGLAATRHILRAGLAAKVVIVTSYDDTLIRTAALEAGAHAYILSGKLQVRDGVLNAGDYVYEPNGVLHDEVVAILRAG